MSPTGDLELQLEYSDQQERGCELKPTCCHHQNHTAWNLDLNLLFKTLGPVPFSLVTLRYKESNKVDPYFRGTDAQLRIYS